MVALVEGGIDSVDVFLIQSVLCHVERIAEALIMDDLPFTEEAERIEYIGIVNEAEQIIVGDASLLLCCNEKCTTFSEIPVNFDGNIACSGDPLPHGYVINEVYNNFSSQVL